MIPRITLTDPDEGRAAKRSSDSQNQIPHYRTESGTPRGKRQRANPRAGQLAGPIQQIAQLFIINQYEEVAKNVVWLSRDDFINLFSVMPANTPDMIQSKHIQIANRVYQVAIKNWLEAGQIGVTPKQHDDIRDRHAIFIYEGSNAIQLSAFSPQPRHINTLFSVNIDIEPNEEFGPTPNGLKTLDLDYLRDAFMRSLRDKYVSYGQVFYIDDPIGRFKATIRGSHSYASVLQNALLENRLVSPFGLILESTEMDFQIRGSSDYIIVNREVIDKDTKFTFNVTCSDNLDKNETVPLPLKIDMQILSDEVRKALNTRSLLIGHKYTIKHQGLWNLQLKFDKVSNKNQAKIPDAIAKKYDCCYRFTDQSPLEFSSARDVVLTSGAPVRAKEVDFEIISVTDNSLGGQFIDRKWIDVEELKQAIYKIPSTAVNGQKFTLNLSKAKVVVQLKKSRATVPPPKKHNKNWKKQWVLDQNAQINFRKSWLVDWHLVDNPKPVEASQVSLTISTEGRSIFTVTEKEIEEAARKAIEKGVLLKQNFTIEIKSHEIELQVSDIDYEGKSKNPARYGVIGTILPATKIKFINESENLAITSKTTSRDPVEHLEELGVGGLSEKGRKIIRKIVNERRSPMKEELDKRGIKPTKGLMLYGPPGTGKTLLARCIGTILGCDEEHIQLLSGTKVFNKWVGESEKNVRALFEPALEAAKKFKNDSEVFVVVIDEIDGILSKRSGDHNKWRDTVVNEFLAQMDGLEQFHNILIIGMTNRLHELDDAVVRSGRFSDKVEIGIPDLKGRKQILEIHTRELRRKNLLHSNVNLDEIAARTDKYSGADIEGLVKIAGGYAIERLSQLAYMGENLDGRNEALTTMDDFDKAIDELKKTDPNAMSDEVKRMYT